MKYLLILCLFFPACSEFRIINTNACDQDYNSQDCKDYLNWQAERMRRGRDQ